MKTTWNFAALMIAAVPVLAIAQAKGSMPPDCSRVTVVQCERLVVQRLQSTPAMSPKDAIQFVQKYWDPKFRAAYNALGKDQKSSPSDQKKIEDEVRSRLNPVNYIKDQAIKELVEKYLPRLAPVLAAISSAPVEALMIVFWPSPTAGPATELRLGNKRVNDALWKLLAPHMKQQWEKAFWEDLKTKVGPSFGVPVPPAS